jgi:hypothetical protein
MIVTEEFTESENYTTFTPVMTKTSTLLKRLADELIAGIVIAVLSALVSIAFGIFIKIYYFSSKDSEYDSLTESL